MPTQGRSDSLRRYNAKRKHHPDQSFIASRYWRDVVRPAQLAREPFCKHCLLLGRNVKATDVDHRIPPNGSITLQRDFGNLQSLCHSHHSAKTRAQGKPGSHIVGYRVDGYPIFAK